LRQAAEEDDFFAGQVCADQSCRQIGFRCQCLIVADGGGEFFYGRRIVVFGGATILLRDDRFIMWKPTVLFWIGALVLLISHLSGKNGLKATMGKELELPEHVWSKLTYAWVAFMIFLGIANWFVFTHFKEQWVNYKMFGSTGFLFVFFIAQFSYLSRYLPKKDN